MASIIINAFVAVVAVLAWLQVLRGRGTDAELAARGAGSLKYYTVLSNLFCAIVSAVYLVGYLLPGRAPSVLILALKLAGAAVVMITFFVTALLLTPKLGWKALYSGGNFWLHLVLPLLAAIDVCVFVPAGTLPLWATLGSVVFTGIYAVGYLRPVLKYGAEKDGTVYDFYGFLRWGEDKIWLVGGSMLLASWLIALALRWLSSLWG